ncbi:MAG: SCO family protein, partial [Akkermansiaceae bacterium]
MTDKQKIATIYISVAVISALILAVTFYIRSHGLQQSQQKPYYSKDSKLEPLLTLKEDITLKNQDGEEVKISDLKGKVWAVAQFYASCPMCAERNDQGLKQLYEKFKDVPDFQLVCITVDPATDGVAEMKSYADALDASTKNWWFLTGEAEP